MFASSRKRIMFHAWGVKAVFQELNPKGSPLFSEAAFKKFNNLY